MGTGGQGQVPPRAQVGQEPLSALCTAAPNPLGPRASSGTEGQRHRLDTLGTPGHAADWAPPIGLKPLLVWESRAAARPPDFLKQSHRCDLQLGDCWEASGLATPPLTLGGSGLVGRQATEDPTPCCPHTPAEGLKTPPLGGGTTAFVWGQTCHIVSRDLHPGRVCM